MLDRIRRYFRRDLVQLYTVEQIPEFLRETFHDGYWVTRKEYEEKYRPTCDLHPECGEYQQLTSI